MAFIFKKIILKEWFNMKEIKNGVISEEALEEIAGGLSLSKEKVIDVLKKVGIKIGNAINVLGGEEEWQEMYLTNEKNNQKSKKIPYEY